MRTFEPVLPSSGPMPSTVSTPNAVSTPKTVSKSSSGLEPDSRPSPAVVRYPSRVLSPGTSDRLDEPEPDRALDRPETLVRQAIARGDLDCALEVLMDTFGTAVYRYCRHLVGDAELAEEVHQTTFIQAYDGLEGFRGHSSLRTWLFGIARHRSLDAVKIRRRRDRRFQLTDRLPERPSPLPPQDDQLSARSHLAALADCLAALGPRVRDAILLRFQQGLSYVEMARVADERPPALRARVVRALPALRHCLESKGATP